MKAKKYLKINGVMSKGARFKKAPTGQIGNNLNIKNNNNSQLGKFKYGLDIRNLYF